MLCLSLTPSVSPGSRRGPQRDGRRSRRPLFPRLRSTCMHAPTPRGVCVVRRRASQLTLTRIDLTLFMCMCNLLCSRLGCISPACYGPLSVLYFAVEAHKRKRIRLEDTGGKSSEWVCCWLSISNAVLYLVRLRACAGIRWLCVPCNHAAYFRGLLKAHELAVGHCCWESFRIVVMAPAHVGKCGVALHWSARWDLYGYPSHPCHRLAVGA